MDLPTYMEANVITTTAIKVAWVFCYILVYGLRPVIVRPKKVGEPTSSPEQVSVRRGYPCHAVSWGRGRRHAVLCWRGCRCSHSASPHPRRNGHRWVVATACNNQSVIGIDAPAMFLCYRSASA